MDHLFPSAMKLRNFYRNKHIYVPEHSLCLMTAGQMYEKYYASYHTIPLGMARLENNQYTIEIMCQQSELGMLKTLAHEMLHLFMYNRNLWPEKSICEGFCNLGSYLALCELESENPETLHLLAQLMENRDRSYGEGFRRLKLIYDLKGMDGCIAVLREFYGRHRE